MWSKGSSSTENTEASSKSDLLDSHQSGGKSVSEPTCQLCMLPVEWVTRVQGSPRSERGELAWRMEHGGRICIVHSEVSQHLSVALSSCLSTEQICCQHSQTCYSYLSVWGRSCLVLRDTSRRWVFSDITVILLGIPLYISVTSSHSEIVPTYFKKTNLRGKKKSIRFFFGRKLLAGLKLGVSWKRCLCNIYKANNKQLKVFHCGFQFVGWSAPRCAFCCREISIWNLSWAQVREERKKTELPVCFLSRVTRSARTIGW